MEQIVVNVVVRGADRVRALEELKRREHSSRTSIMNKALDLLIEREGLLERECAAGFEK